MTRRMHSWLLTLLLVVATAGSAFADPARGSGPVVADQPEQDDQPITVHQTDLVSDQPGVAPTQDPNLVNAWGMASTSSSPIWVADNGAGVSTLYNGAGQRFPIGNPLVVTIPAASGSPAGAKGTPTGVVANGTTDFKVSGTASRFIFATEDGTIAAWVSGTSASRMVDDLNPATGPVYKGLALASSGGTNYLYAANFRAGTIDVFGPSFQPATLPGSFRDPQIPAGFAPFNVQLLNGQLYVTYAQQDADREDDVAGQGHGFVDVFTTDGNLDHRLATRGQLNSPWGLAIAPASFGRVAGDVLVGNFGDGGINIYTPSGTYVGAVRDERHHKLKIDGLWGLRVGNGGNGGDPNTVYFTAGPNDESHGLFGSLTPVQAENGKERRG